MDNTQLPAEVVDKLLRARDALVYGDLDEAYHQLYAIANPKFDSFLPWKEMEEQINYPNTFKPDIEARRQVTEYANNLNQVQAKCDRYEAALKDIANGKLVAVMIAAKALSAVEGQKEGENG